MSSEEKDDAPLRVTSDIARPAAPGQRREKRQERSAAGASVAARLRWLVPLALAAPALVLPRGWLVVSALVAIGAGVWRESRELGGTAGTVLVAPAKLLGRIAAGFLPVVLLMVLLAAVFAFAMPAVIAAVFWLLEHGSLGALTSARLAVVHWSPALASAVVCAVLLRVSLIGSSRTSGVLHDRFLATASERLLVVCAGVSVVVVLAFALGAGPSALTLTGLVPGSLRGDVVGLNQTWAQDQTNDVLACIQKHSGVSWAGRVRRHGDRLSLVLTQVTGRPAGRGDVAALMISLQEQLQRNVTTIRLRHTQPRLASRHASKRADKRRRRAKRRAQRPNHRRRRRAAPARAPQFVFSRRHLSLPLTPILDGAQLATAAGLSPGRFLESPSDRRMTLTCGARML